MSMKSNKKKIILVVIIIIVLLFLIIIFVRKRQQMYFVKESFQEYMTITEDSTLKGEYSNYKDGYSFSVNEPKGLSLKGNLGISNEEGNLLLIVKEYKKDDVICILLSDKNMEYPLIINENGDMKTGLSYEPFQEDLLNENKEVIHQLIVQYNLWQKAARTADINYFN